MWMGREVLSRPSIQVDGRGELVAYPFSALKATRTQEPGQPIEIMKHENRAK